MLTSSRSFAPLTDQMWLKRMPTVHGPGCVSATTEGPIPNFSEPSEVFVAAGSRNDRARAPDDAAGLRGREEGGRDDVAQSVDPGVARVRVETSAA